MKKLLLKIGFLSALILMVWALSTKKITMTDLADIKPIEIDVPQIQNVSPQNEKSVFYSDDKFKIEYPSSWFGVNSAEILAALTPQDWAEKYNLKTLFFAQSFQQQGKFAQLIIYKGNFDVPAEEIFDKKREGNEKQGWEIKVIESKIQKNEAVFDSEYRKTPDTVLHVEEKILLAGNKAYLVSITVQEKDWLALKETVDKILNSAIIVSEDKM